VELHEENSEENGSNYRTSEYASDISWFLALSYLDNTSKLYMQESYKIKQIQLMFQKQGVIL
jgi:hypothetical protein